MTQTTRVPALAGRAAVALFLAVALFATMIGGAAAAPPEQANPNAGGQSECAGRGIPESQISIQLFTLARLLGFGSPSEEVLDEVLGGLSDIGYRSVELYGQPYSAHTADELREILKRHDIRAVSSHGSQDEEAFAETAAYAKRIGQQYIGAGGPPGDYDTYEEALETAATLNRLGEIAQKTGLKAILVHNHQNEFRTMLEDPETGEVKSAWEVLVENTDHRYVTFELDTLWAANAGVDVVEVIEEYGHRIDLLHVKDGTDLDANRATITRLGEGDLDFEAIFAAAKGKVKVYAFEYDFAPNGLADAAHAYEFLSCITF